MRSSLGTLDATSKAPSTIKLIKDAASDAGLSCSCCPWAGADQKTLQVSTSMGPGDVGGGHAKVTLVSAIDRRGLCITVA